MSIRTLLAASAVLGLAAAASPAAAQWFGPPAAEQTGKEIYSNICQSCHMPDGKGGQGAGAYPALAGNPRLAAKAYPALVIVRGQKAMPEFGSALSDAQVSEVVNYIRTQWGNSFADTLTPAEVKPLRPVPVGKTGIRAPG